MSAKGTQLLDNSCSMCATCLCGCQSAAWTLRRLQLPGQRQPLLLMPPPWLLRAVPPLLPWPLPVLPDLLQLLQPASPSARRCTLPGSSGHCKGTRCGACRAGLCCPLTAAGRSRAEQHPQALQLVAGEAAEGLARCGQESLQTLAFRHVQWRCATAGAQLLHKTSMQGCKTWQCWQGRPGRQASADL